MELLFFLVFSWQLLTFIKVKVMVSLGFRGNRTGSATAPRWLVVFAMLAMAPIANAADDTWGANAGTAWYTAGNWLSGTQFPGLQGAAASNNDIATFSSASTATTFGINMGTNSLNLGAIVADSTRITATNIGNSSATAGVLRLYGATANSVANTILWNAGTGLVTLQAAQAGGGTMGVVLGNTTNVIQITGSGGITISSNITESNLNSGITRQGSGSGTLTLSGTNTYTGVTTISAGTLQFATVASLYNGTTSSWTAANINVSGTLALNVGGAGQFTTANVTALLTNLGGVVTSNGLRSGSRIAFDTTGAGGNFTVADNIANTTGTGGGAIRLNKLGTGVLTLTGTNSYTGTTTITAGTLRVSSTSIGTGTVSFSSSVNTAVLAAISSTPISIPGNVTNGFTPGTFTFGDATGTGAITLAGGLSLSPSGAGNRTVNTVVDVNVTGLLTGADNASLTKSGAATLTLSNVGGTTNGANNVTVTAGVLAVTRLANSTANSSIGRTNVLATVASIRLNGGALNYVDGGAAASSTDRLLQVGTTVVALTGTIRNNATSASETVTFSNPNAILYGTIDQTRTLVLGGTNIGLNTLASIINNNGAAVVNVTKQDAGTWVISGANGYTGATTVSDGTLVVNGSTATGSAVSVNGGTLGGSGTIIGTVAVNPGGTLRGDSGTLTGNLNLAGNATVTGSTTYAAGGAIATYLDVTSGTINANSKLLTGATTLAFSDLGGTGTFNFRLLNDNGLTLGTPYTITIATNAGGSFTGTGGNFVVLSGTGSYDYASTSLNVVGNDLQLTFTPTVVPEPGTILGLSAVSLGLARWVRRRRSAP